MTTTTAALQISKVGSTMATTSSAIRKRANKPLMEKRRRARINRSLSDLRNLILDYLKKESARSNKLEKADILETTLQYLQELQRSQTAVNVAADQSISNKYQAGYNECVKEVRRYLRSNSDAGLSDPAVSEQVIDYITDTRCRSRVLQAAENCIKYKGGNAVSTSDASPQFHQMTTQRLQTSDQGVILVLKTPIIGNCNNQLSIRESATDSIATSFSGNRHVLSFENFPMQFNITENRLNKDCEYSLAEISSQAKDNDCSPNRRNQCNITAQLPDNDLMWRPW